MTRDERQRRLWERVAPSYDSSIARVDARFMAASRTWACQRAHGDVLEVAIGTGLSLPSYPPGVRITGLDQSSAMLARARHRAAQLGLAVELVEGDAQALPGPESSFDSVVCAFALCSVPNVRAVLSEMIRVLRPGGDLLLVDHVASSNPFLRAGQYLLDAVTVPTQNEHWTRRPLGVLRQMDVDIVETDRLHHGLIERVHARRR